MIDDLLIAAYTFSVFMLISLSVDEILMPRYVKWSLDSNETHQEKGR